MTAPRLRVVEGLSAPERTLGLREALTTGQLSPEQAALLGALLDALAPGTAPAGEVTAAIGNDELVERYLRAGRSRGWRAETLRVRGGQLRQLAAALAPTPLIEATEEQLVAWRERLVGKPETVGSHTSAARGLYRWAAVEARPRLRLDDPAAILRRPRVPQAQPRPIVERHYELALACAVSDPEVYVWLGLMGCSGLRCCEVAWMRGVDVEERPDGGALLHIEGKGGKRRTVPAGSALLLTMRPFLASAGAGPVFRRPSDGTAYTPNGVSDKVNTFLRGIGVHATAHQLRHRFGTDYHAIDADLYRQAQLMGHGSVDTTQRYTLVDPREAAQYIEALTRRRFGGTR